MRPGMPKSRKRRGPTEQGGNATAHKCPAPRALHEPVEPDHMSAANDALDMIERCVRTVLDAGGEFALRRRLEKLLPL